MALVITGLGQAELQQFIADGNLTQLRMHMFVIKSTRGSLCR